MSLSLDKKHILSIIDKINSLHELESFRLEYLGKKGILPKEQDPDQTHKIMQFQILKASVRAYKNNLNTHNAYKEFREVRARLRQDEKQITGLDLTKYLKNYAAIGEKYVAILEDIIKNNSLTDFDKANLLPTKLKKGVAL